jgi:hypothetical protein
MGESNADKNVIQDLLETPARHFIANNKKTSRKKIRLHSCEGHKRVMCDHIYIADDNDNADYYYYYYYSRLYARYLQLHTLSNHVSVVYNVAAIL